MEWKCQEEVVHRRSVRPAFNFRLHMWYVYVYVDENKHQAPEKNWLLTLYSGWPTILIKLAVTPKKRNSCHDFVCSERGVYTQEHCHRGGLLVFRQRTSCAEISGSDIYHLTFYVETRSLVNLYTLCAASQIHSPENLTKNYSTPISST